MFRRGWHRAGPRATGAALAQQTGVQRDWPSGVTGTAVRPSAPSATTDKLGKCILECAPMVDIRKHKRCMRRCLRQTVTAPQSGHQPGRSSVSRMVRVANRLSNGPRRELGQWWGRVSRNRNQDTPESAAQQETGSPPLEVQLPDQPGMTEGATGAVPHAGPWPGLHCMGHPNIPGLVCCSRRGLYGTHDYFCYSVPQ